MRGRILSLGAAFALLGLAACGPGPAGEPPAEARVAGASAAAPSTDYVGTGVCAGCHAEETERWRDSHHDLAMQEAGPASVLADFDVSFTDARGVETRFRREGDRYLANAEGPGGERADFQVLYSFGADPLQQYLVALPGGRLQVLDPAWDARPAAAGGQRWYSIHGDEPIPPGDVLHWSGPAGSWNSMCAECHSTNLQKSYAASSDRFDTTWSELDVSCEACHGPGSRHVEWARSGSSGSTGLVAPLSNDGAWVFAPGAAIAHRVPERTGNDELDACAPCHSRRSSLRSGPAPGRPFLDGHVPALLLPGLYRADGQIEDEVYEWGSFLQSRMHAAGIVCSDCHDPHSLRVADPPDATCSRCHRPQAFAAPGHHHHAEGSAGASCIACHMPERVYMEIDARHDHSLRAPRPELARRIGSRDACQDCHADRGPGFTAEAARTWWGPPDAEREQGALALHAARQGMPGADAALAAVVRDAHAPGITRATALSMLADPSAAPAAGTLAAGLRDPDPLVRLGALAASERIDPHSRLALVKPLLRDPLLALRGEAARVLADLPRSAFGDADWRLFEEALAEYEAAQLVHAELPSTHVNLGILALRRGDRAAARAAYERAVHLGPWFVPGWINLADLQRTEGREAEAEATLRRGLEAGPDSADLQHALGLALVRQQRLPEALTALARAAELAPENPRYAYVLAVGLHGAGRGPEALAVLAAARALHPRDVDLLQGMLAFAREAGEAELAGRLARELADREAATATGE